MKTKLAGCFLVLLLWTMLGTAQIHPPSTLRNELDQKQLDASAREVVVLIHGWTGKSSVPAGYNRYEDAADATELNYLFNILKLKLTGSRKKLVTYHWEEDASTGSVEFLGGIDLGYGNATEAAINAQQHGASLGNVLHQRSPELRIVHFVAHSAGSWAAREAAKTLLALNPYVVVQMTLLDPFIPDAFSGMTTGLSSELMSSTDEPPSSDRIYRLENYYSDDRLVYLCLQLPTISTQEQFGWRPLRDINRRVDWLRTIGLVCDHYPTHSGPIEFYADTVSASIQGTPVPSGLEGLLCPFVYNQVGWYRSIFFESYLLPKITAQPKSQAVQVGGSVSFSVTANRAVSFQWFKNDQQYSATGSTLTLNSVSANDAGEFVVRVSNASGQAYSEKAVLQVTPTPPPTIFGVTPSSLNALPLGQTQPLTVTGSGFTSNSRLTFNDGVKPPYEDRVPTFINASELRYDIAVGPEPATWTVKVVEAGIASLPYTFYVVDSAAPCADLYEPNNSSPYASDLNIGQSITTRICNPTDVDWFKVNVTEPGPLTFTLTVPADNDYDIELYGPDTFYIKGSYGDVGAAEMITHNAMATGDYYVRVYGYPSGNGSFNTAMDYTLTANFSSGAITVVPPQDRTVVEGASAGFSVVAGGAQPLSYRWQRNGSGDIPDANGSSYVTPPATLADSGAQFRVIVTNAFGGVTSSWATLTVNAVTFGNTIIWVGGYPNGWNNPTNWSPEIVPTGSDSVLINSGGVTVPTGATFGLLRLEGGSVSGTFTVAGTLTWTDGTINGGDILIASGGGVEHCRDGGKVFRQRGGGATQQCGDDQLAGQW